MPYSNNWRLFSFISFSTVFVARNVLTPSSLFLSPSSSTWTTKIFLFFSQLALEVMGLGFLFADWYWCERIVANFCSQHGHENLFDVNTRLAAILCLLANASLVRLSLDLPSWEFFHDWLNSRLGWYLPLPFVRWSFLKHGTMSNRGSESSSSSLLFFSSVSPTGVLWAKVVLRRTATHQSKKKTKWHDFHFSRLFLPLVVFWWNFFVSPRSLNNAHLIDYGEKSIDERNRICDGVSARSGMITKPWSWFQAEFVNDRAMIWRWRDVLYWREVMMTFPNSNHQSLALSVLFFADVSCDGEDRECFC